MIGANELGRAVADLVAVNAELSPSREGLAVELQLRQLGVEPEAVWPLAELMAEACAAGVSFLAEGDEAREEWLTASGGIFASGLVVGLRLRDAAGVV